LNFFSFYDKITRRRPYARTRFLNKEGIRFFGEISAQKEENGWLIWILLAFPITENTACTI
jgi:hypothetical protein